jgi:putative endonuclease
MRRKFYVYIMSSKSGVLYAGSTDDIDRRTYEHQHGLLDGFTRKYRCTRCVYVEEFENPSEMVARERQLKGWSRAKKLALIHSQNPLMVDYARKSARGPSTPGASAQDDLKERIAREKEIHSLRESVQTELKESFRLIRQNARHRRPLA